MAKTATMADEGKSRRISTDIDDEKLFLRLLKAKKKLGIKTNGGFGYAAIEFAIARIEAGELIALNGKLISPSEASK